MGKKLWLLLARFSKFCDYTEMKVLGGAGYYLYGKVKPKEESISNNANPANAQSSLRKKKAEDRKKES